MLGLKSTFLKKLFSESVETNSLTPINPEISQTIIPTLNLDPNIEIVKAGSVTTTTIYTTPTDKDFYLTNLHLSAFADDALINSITVTKYNGETVTFTATSSGFLETAHAGDNINLTFPMKGIKLAKNSAITSVGGATGTYIIAGYLGSDRS